MKQLKIEEQIKAYKKIKYKVDNLEIKGSDLSNVSDAITAYLNAGNYRGTDTADRLNLLALYYDKKSAKLNKVEK